MSAEDDTDTDTPNLVEKGEPKSQRGRVRRRQILRAAEDLIGELGFETVSLKDIGERAGIVGSGVYRHFSSKRELLAELFDRAAGELLHGAQRTVTNVNGASHALEGLVEGHVSFTLGRWRLNQVYVREIHNLDPHDRARLLGTQRDYLCHWVDTLCELRPDLSEHDARIVCLAAIGAIHSALHHERQRPDSDVGPLLRSAALAVLESSSRA